jgi:hypothetical protein
MKSLNLGESCFTGDSESLERMPDRLATRLLTLTPLVLKAPAILEGMGDFL